VCGAADGEDSAVSGDQKPSLPPDVPHRSLDCRAIALSFLPWEQRGRAS